jgi:putative transposase
MLLSDIGKVLEEEWSKTNDIRLNVDLDYYAIMPNHFHGIIIIKDVEDVPARRLKCKGDGSTTRLYES